MISKRKRNKPAAASAPKFPAVTIRFQTTEQKELCAKIDSAAEKVGGNRTGYCLFLLKQWGEAQGGAK